MPKNKKLRKNRHTSPSKKPLDNEQKILETLNIQIIQFHQQGDNQKALALSQKALVRFPHNLDLLRNAGIFASMLNDLNLAKKYMLQSLELDKNNADSHNNLAILFQNQGQLNKAERHYIKALEVDPIHVNAYNNFAILLKKQKRFDELKKHYQATLRLNPNNANVHYNLANLFKKQKRFEQSKVHYQEVLKINPNNVSAYNNLGDLFNKEKKLHKAKECFEKVLKIDKNHVNAHCNLGLLLHKKKHFNKALEHYQKALSINPDYVDARWNLSLLQLILEGFSKGFELYEVRYSKDKKDDSIVPPTTPTPQYQSQDLNQDLQDKHILILPEQGVGDEVMFASILPELAPIVQQHSNTCITLACDARLVEIFNRSFDFLTAISKDPDNRYQNIESDLDYWLFIGSLPKFYRNKIKDFNKHQPYLVAEKMLFSIWKNRFNKLEHDINIGISWTGGKKAEHKKDRSLTLEQMLPILTKASQNANLINLQYGDHTKEIQDFTTQTGITIHDWDDADPLKDLDNFAAQIKALDLVISIDNSTVHFAGALGTKTFVMLPFNQDWRWAEDRNDSYWYPNIMTLFRQTQDGQWDDVIQNVTNNLKQTYNTDKA